MAYFVFGSPFDKVLRIMMAVFRRMLVAGLIVTIWLSGEKATAIDG
jgi:hypothetical protein